MRLKELTLDQLREINISGLSDRQLRELEIELLLRILMGKRYSRKEKE